MTTAGALAVSGHQDEIVPLAYLAAEEANRDRQLTDALFLTFNADLAFLEARILGLCHAAGARVTVLADANVWSPDVRSVRFAGRQYHVGLVAGRGAFHPKLSLFVGAHRVLAIVGSGNLTLGGWQYNAELATVLSADVEQAPVALTDLRNALDDLTSGTELDPTTRGVVRSVITKLSRVLEQSEPVDTGHRIAASWQGPLIEQLPAGPVDELLLTAAFHDPGANAVRALLDRLSPRRVRVAVQPGWTEFDPASLDKTLSRYAAMSGASVQVVRDPEDPASGRYRHGKLIEWADGGERFTLTGSPNLSVAALLLDALRGNHELAVTGPIAKSLFPGGDPLQLADLPASSKSYEVDSRSGRPVITAVVVTDGGLRLHLAHIVSDAELELSRLMDQPENWEVAATVDASTAVVDVPVEIAGGSRVRLTWVDIHGVRQYSAVHFVTDPRTALRTPGQINRRSRTKRAQPDDLWGEDLSFLSSVLDDLTALSAELATRRVARSLAKGASADEAYGSGRESADDHEVEPWLWIQSETVNRLGPGLAPFALGLPALPTGINDWEPDWVDAVIADSDAGLDDDTAEEFQEAGLERIEAGIEFVDHAKDEQHRRVSRQRWCVRAASLPPTLPIELRLFLVRVTIRLWQSGNWEADDPQPVHLVAKLVRSLDVDNLPEQLEKRVGSLTAIALTLLREEIDLTVKDEETMLYNDVAKATRHLVLDADPEVTEIYLRGLVRPDREQFWLDEIEELETDIYQDDPLADVEDSLIRDGFEVYRPGPRKIHAVGWVSNPALTALTAIGQAEDEAGIVVWVSNHRGDWSLVVWNRPNLVSVSHVHGRRTRWRHWVLDGLVGPAALARQARLEDQTSAYDIVTTPRHQRTERADQVLLSVGITDPKPPTTRGSLQPDAENLAAHQYSDD